MRPSVTAKTAERPNWPEWAETFVRRGFPGVLHVAEVSAESVHVNNEKQPFEVLAPLWGKMHQVSRNAARL